MATTYLTRTPGSATDRKTWTYSVWVKRSSLTSASNGHTLFDTEGVNINTNFIYGIKSTDIVYLHNYAGDVFTTSPLLRDVSGWYHIVLALDTTQSTTADRIKLWVNGVAITLSQGSNWPAEDQLMGINNNVAHFIGSHGTNAGYYFDGLMSGINFADGTAYTASTFGQTDSDTGEWTLNTSPSFTLGTNGFSILKDGDTITDQSSNSNNWSLGAGTLTKTEDCPDDVFAVWNSLDDYYADGTYAYGNTQVATGSSIYGYIPATIGASAGKYYFEVKPTAITAAAGDLMVGVTSTQNTSTTQPLGNNASDYAYVASANIRNNGSNSSYGNTYDVDDIIGVALDLTNSKLYFAKNGTWQNSGDPTSGATGTGAQSITAVASTPLGFYFPGISYFHSSATATFQANFGNGYFGTTIISSAGTNASGIGIFEYDVPTGYTAFSTKGLQE